MYFIKESLEEVPVEIFKEISEGVPVRNFLKFLRRFFEGIAGAISKETPGEISEEIPERFFYRNPRRSF